MKRSELPSHRFLVFGAARSGIAAAKLLKRHGADVLLIDGKESPDPATFSDLKLHGISTVWGPDPDHRALDGRTVMVKSPGIPQDNPTVIEARRRGIRVISEIELASAFVSPDAKVIAITGTNGKTTTTAWIAHILKTAGLNGIAAGNIGDAWSNLVDLPENQTDTTVFAVECSSFQLEDVEDFRPDVALLTNFSPDHMDRYKSLQHYRDAKANILKNEPRFFVINACDQASGEFTLFAERVLRLRRFSSNNNKWPHSSDGFDPGVSVSNSLIKAVLSDGSQHAILGTQEVALPGNHNLENALAAAASTLELGISFDQIAEGLRTFPGVEHRTEFCGERPVDGVRFYNDSKATNVDSTEKALLAFDDKMIVLIAGGRDKQTGYAPLVPLMPRLRRLITVGEAAPLIEGELGSHVTLERADDMSDAVRRAAAAAQSGDVVLLSPACASYDMYNNYEERGRHFKALVTEILK